MNTKSDLKCSTTGIRLLRLLLLSLSFVVMLCILVLPPDKVNHTILLSVVPFAAFGFLQYRELRYGRGGSLPSVFFPRGADRRRAGISLILTLLFLFMLSVKEIWAGMLPYAPVPFFFFIWLPFSRCHSS